MGKSTHFIGQPLYSQVIKLLCKSKILQISENLGGERYTKRFNAWIHLVVMLYAVIKRFDSLREITTSLLADTHKLAHIGITFKIGRSTLADANRRRPQDIFEAVIAICTPVTGMNLYRTADAASIPKGWTNSRSLLTNDMDSAPEDIIAIYRQRWEIELLFKQIKQNFPLKYFYGESANAIKIQILVTLIANLILIVMQRRLERKWSFSGLATMVRIALMYYVDFYSLFNNPEKDWENMAVFDEFSPHQLTLF